MADNRFFRVFQDDQKNLLNLFRIGHDCRNFLKGIIDLNARVRLMVVAQRTSLPQRIHQVHRTAFAPRRFYKVQKRSNRGGGPVGGRFDLFNIGTHSGSDIRIQLQFKKFDVAEDDGKRIM